MMTRQDQQDLKILAELFAKAGINVNGSTLPDIQINNPAMLHMLYNNWSLGFGEAYIKGYWDCKQLDQLICKLFQKEFEKKPSGISKIYLLCHKLRSKLFNLQSYSRAFQVGKQHYDIGNDLFQHMLDPYMQYSCGFWKNAKNLNQAQIHKLEMICQKLQLKPGDTVLEIGCGWGGFAEYSTKNYRIKFTGITISKAQQAYATKRCAGLPVKIKLLDYRKIKGRFDKIVSIGMFEHVGSKNYATYFKLINQYLKPSGLFLLHTIGASISVVGTDPWINKYIFPNGKIPSYEEITHNTEGLFHIEDWHNFGQDYDKTLMAWMHNFEATWPQLKSNYSNEFYRMWQYYLLSCAGYFRAKKGQLWQIVFTKIGSNLEYRSVRP